MVSCNLDASWSLGLRPAIFWKILSDFRTRLKEGDILQQWLPGGYKVPALRVAKAIYAVSPFVRFFRSIEEWWLHSLASTQPFEMSSADKFVARLSPEAIADFIEWNPDKSAGTLYQRFAKREIMLKSSIESENVQSVRWQTIKWILLIRQLVSSITPGFSLTAGQAFKQDSKERETIQYLIASVEGLEGSRFIRNGKSVTLKLPLISCGWISKKLVTMSGLRMTL